MTTEEQNAKIAKFMEHELKHVPSFQGDRYSINGEWHTPTSLKYHTSWDWIMPVIEKIYEVDLGNMDDILSALMRAYISEVHSAVVDFIDWYNEQQQ